MKAKEIMSRDVVYIAPGASLKEAYAVMRSVGVRHLPVVDKHKLVGILSDRDVLPFTRNHVVVQDGFVDEVMAESPIVASPKTTIARLAEHMLEYKIDSIPVVDGERMVGLVTSTDLIALLLTPLEPATLLPFEFNLLTPEAFRSRGGQAAVA